MKKLLMIRKIKVQTKIEIFHAAQTISCDLQKILQSTDCENEKFDQRQLHDCNGSIQTILENLKDLKKNGICLECEWHMLLILRFEAIQQWKFV